MLLCSFIGFTPACHQNCSIFLEFLFLCQNILSKIVVRNSKNVDTFLWRNKIVDCPPTQHYHCHKERDIYRNYCNQCNYHTSCVCTNSPPKIVVQNNKHVNTRLWWNKIVDCSRTQHYYCHEEVCIYHNVTIAMNVTIQLVASIPSLFISGLFLPQISDCFIMIRIQKKRKGTQLSNDSLPCYCHGEFPRHNYLNQICENCSGNNTQFVPHAWQYQQWTRGISSVVIVVVAFAA